jgi:OmcA/MtrC family decaheme c-type cytochrome
MLNQCETCHLPGTYDFSATASAAAADRRQFRTVASGTLASTGTHLHVLAVHHDGSSTTAAGMQFNAGTGVTEAAPTTLVTSPTATACFACHDSKTAVAHFEINGGSIYEPRSKALGTTETCMVCHGPGRIAAIKDSHAK